jgi:hypothetical protein
MSLILLFFSSQFNLHLNSISYIRKNLNTMRTIIFSLFLVVGMSAFAQNQKSEVLGYWEVVTINFEGQDDLEKRVQYLEFKSDGTLIGGRVESKSVETEGKWNWKEDEGLLYLAQNQGGGDDGGYSIVELTKNNLVLRNEQMTIYLDRGK